VDETDFWSQRNAAVEDEVISRGNFADTVFMCASSTPDEVEQVHGQAALFALLSPVLRERLTLGNSPNRDSENRQVVWLADEITALAFREVARYVYRLPPRLVVGSLAEVVMAARILQMQEFEQVVLHSGFSNLGNLMLSRGDSETTDAPDEFEGPDQIGDALSFLGALCVPVGGESLNVEEDAMLLWRGARH